jgi:glycosyltransferase involved in cell wall biosynthesis
MPFFSLIVPVYGIENYIDECVSSVLNQSFQDYELILVDDGGKDNCPQICDQYEANHSSIIALHKTNGGLSSARNYGLKHASGQYVVFIDGDDYLCDIKALEIIHETLQENEYDIVSYNRRYLNGDTVKEANDYRISDNSINDYNSFIKKMIQTDTFYGSAWVLCSRRAFLIENKLFFTEGRTTEDFDWLMRVISCCPTICNLPDVFYMYRTNREGSITSHIDRKRHEDYLFFLNKYAYYPFNNNDLREIMLNYVAYQFVIFCANAYRIKDKKDRSYFKEQQKSLMFLLDYDLMPQTKKVKKTSRIIGYSLTDKLLGIKARMMR